MLQGYDIPTAHDKSVTVEDDTSRKLMAEQQNLKTALKLLTKSQQTGEPGIGFAKVWEVVKNSIQAMDAIQTKFIKPKFYNETVPTSGKHLATRVFDVPEVFERILLHLSIRDLLAIPTVNKQFKNAIYGSKRVQQHILMLPSPHFKILGNELPGITRLFRMFPNEKSTLTDFDFKLSFDAIEIGSRCREMLICTPKPRSISFEPECCQRGKKEYVPKSENGMTVGEMFDEATKMKKEHRSCAWAHWSEHDSDGFITTDIVFRTEVELLDDDPLIPRSKERLHGNDQWLSERGLAKERWKPFMHAKRKAWKAGKRILTLQEFEQGIEDGNSSDDDDDLDDTIDLGEDF